MGCSEDLRKEVLSYLQESYTQENVHQVFKVETTAIKRWKKQYLETGCLKNKLLHRTHKKIDPKKLLAYVSESPDAYLREIAEVFGCTGEAVRQALKKRKITLKKKTMAYRERNEEKRKAFIEQLSEFPNDRIVYVDETGMDCFLCRKSVRALRGQKVFGLASGQSYK